MKKIASLILALILIFALVSCGPKSDAPSGMKPLGNTESESFRLYVPEGWVDSSNGQIYSAHVSSIDTTSLTFVKSEMPDLTIGAGETDAIKAYFLGEIQRLDESLSPEILLQPTECDFGKEGFRANKAYKATYKVKYNSGSLDGEGKPAILDVCFMQIFIIKGTDFYIMTYSANLATRFGGEESYYDYHMSEVESIIAEFKFTGESAEAGTPTEYPVTEDGKLISNRTHTGFDFYVPESYKVNFPTASSQFVSASNERGSTVSMGKVTRAAAGHDAYFADQISRLDAIAEIITRPEEGSTAEVITLGEGINAAFVEYSYSLGGVSYKTYHVLLRNTNDLFSNPYSFTYTAKIENYDADFDEAREILSKVRL